MSDRIYSITRCVGPEASECVHRLIRNDCTHMYSTHKVGGSDEDQIIWFYKGITVDRSKRPTEKFLLDTLQELGKGNVYDRPYAGYGGTPNYNGTVMY
jgi:hypothetical protein